GRVGGGGVGGGGGGGPSRRARPGPRRPRRGGRTRRRSSGSPRRPRKTWGEGAGQRVSLSRRAPGCQGASPGGRCRRPGQTFLNYPLDAAGTVRVFSP